MAEHLTPSALARKAEQQERDERIVRQLNWIHANGHAQFDSLPDGMAEPNFLWDLQGDICNLHSEGMLRRDGDIGCLRDWITQVADEMSEIARGLTQEGQANG